MAMQVGTSLLTGGSSLAPMLTMGGYISGGQYADLREAGVSPEVASAASLTNATLQAPLEQLGLNRFMGIFKSQGIKDLLKNMAGAGATEYATEYLQQYPEDITNLWAMAEKHGTDLGAQMDWFVGNLQSTETWKKMHEEGTESGLIGMLWGMVGGAVHAGINRKAMLDSLQSWADKQKDFHKVVEGVSVKQDVPELMNGALQAAGVTERVELPAEAVLTLYEGGTDIITPMGWDLQSVQQEAAAGGNMEAELSRMHAWLDDATFGKAAEIAIPGGQEMSTQAAASSINELVSLDTEQINEKIAQWNMEQTARSQQLDRLRRELTESVSSVPNIKALLTQQNTTQKDFVEAQLRLVTRQAEILAANSNGTMTAADWLGVQNFNGLTVNERGELVPKERKTAETPAEELEHAMYRAREDSITAFVERVMAEEKGSKASFFEIPGLMLPHGATFRIMSDAARHTDSRHKNIKASDYEVIPDLVKNISGANTLFTGVRGSFGYRFKGMQDVGGTEYGYVFDVANNGSVSLVTFFKDNHERMVEWLNKKEKRAPTAQAAPSNSEAVIPTLRGK